LKLKHMTIPIILPFSRTLSDFLGIQSQEETKKKKN